MPTLQPAAEWRKCHFCPIGPQPCQWHIPFWSHAPEAAWWHRHEGEGMLRFEEQIGSCWESCGYWEPTMDSSHVILVKLLFFSFSQVTSFTMAQNYSFIATSGPTWDDLPPFQWSTSPFKNMLHMGQPDLWKFSPIQVHWGWRFPWWGTPWIWSQLWQCAALHLMWAFIEGTMNAQFFFSWKDEIFKIVAKYC